MSAWKKSTYQKQAHNATMTLFFFALKLFLKRIIRDLILRSPLVSITALLLTILFIYVNRHFTLTEPRFIGLLAVLYITSISSLWFKKQRINLALLRFCNSRYSNQKIILFYSVLQVLRTMIPSLVVCLLLVLGLLEVYADSGQLLDKRTSLVIFALFFGFSGLSCFLFQQFCTWQVQRSSSQNRRVPQLFLPRLKSVLSDYVSPDYLLGYLFILCLSVYILYDFIKAFQSDLEPQSIKNYALVFLCLGAFSFMGIVDSVEHIQWSFLVFSGLGYGFFCIRSIIFLSISSVPVWVPFFIIYISHDPLAALLFLLCLGLNLIFMIHISLLVLPLLLKFLVPLGVIAFSVYAYYAYSPFGFILLAPLIWVIVRSREAVYDWGAYD
jgi:hypothetical protein